MDVFFRNKEKRDLRFSLVAQLNSLSNQFFLLLWENRQISKIGTVAWDFFFFACEREVPLECVALTPIDSAGLKCYRYKLRYVKYVTFLFVVM